MSKSKTFDDFCNYMWKIYPKDSQLSEREAMLKTWNFLSGQYDQEELEREEISKKIKEQMIKNGFGPKL